MNKLFLADGFDALAKTRVDAYEVENDAKKGGKPSNRLSLD